MGCLKSNCGCWVNNAFASNLGKCFKQLTATTPTTPTTPTYGNNSCQCRTSCTARANDSCNRWLSGTTDKIKWLRRYRIYAADKSKCDCRKSNPKEYWYDTNRNIIMALGRVLGLHADVIAEFLYTLTMQNFSLVLNPRGFRWNSCPVPLSNYDTCDFYCGIFDSEGNVRNPYHPESLRKLLEIMQSVLKESKESDYGAHRSLFGTAKNPGEQFIKKSKAERAGFGTLSFAKENGRRRRYRVYENYRLDGIDTSSADYKKTFAGAFDPSAGIWKKIPVDRQFYKHLYNASQGIRGSAKCDGQDGKNQLGSDLENELKKDSSFKALVDDSSVRGSHLADLISQVKDKVGIRRDYKDLVKAMRNLDLKKARTSELERSKDMAKAISDEYHDTITGRRRTPIIPQVYGLQKDQLTSSRNSENKFETRKKRKSKRRSHYYYGAQVPILLHEPFNSNKPWTWIRRHPRATRMDEAGNLVDHSIIHRYKRASVERQLELARRRVSVRTIYSERDDSVVSASAPVEQRPMEQRPTSKKSSTFPKKPRKTKP